VLCADRWLECGDVYNSAAGPSDLRDVCLDLKLVQWDKPTGPEEEELTTVLAKQLHLLSERQCSCAHSLQLSSLVAALLTRDGSAA
jgi:hypothetical protein